jgi:hypothetical protein
MNDSLEGLETGPNLRKKFDVWGVPDALTRGTPSFAKSHLVRTRCSPLTIYLPRPVFFAVFLLSDSVSLPVFAWFDRS